MIRLEHVADGSVSDRNFQKLMSLVLDTGGVNASVRWGTKSFTWPGATAVQSFTINHGLPTTPQVVLAVNGNNNTQGLPRTLSYTATTFSLSVIAPAAVAAAVADTYYWLAIG